MTSKATYVLHFEKKIGGICDDDVRAEHGKGPRVTGKPHYARHYTGGVFDVSDDPDFDVMAALEVRLKDHFAGSDAKIVAYVQEHGIGFALAAVFVSGPYADEKKLKARKDTPSICPICRREMEYQDFEPGEDVSGKIIQKGK